MTGSFTGSQTVKSEKKKMNETLRNKIPFYTGKDPNWCAATVHAFDLLNR